MIDTSTMIRLEDLAAAPLEDAEELAEFGTEAEDFLCSHRWCRSIRQGYFWDGWAGILAIFYVEIEPAGQADGPVWVIVGDIPPAYMDIVTCPEGADALECYVGAMQEWVDHVKKGQPVDDQIPVRRRVSLAPMPPTLEAAEMLESRLEFIRERLLPQLRHSADSPPG